MVNDPSVLKLTAGEQSWLAELASKARSLKYNYGQGKETSDNDLQELGLWFLTHVVENNRTPQQFDDMFDKLHRSGANF